MLRSIYKRVTCARVECAAVTYRKVNSMVDKFNMPCSCQAGVLIKIVNGKETTRDNDINPRVFFKRKYKKLEVES